ncbi:MAG: hypothetical protein U0X91_01075 [Spirosomataceae bacterium]
MKTILRNGFTVLMALIVLTASTGFGVIEHHCMMRGKSLHLAALQKEGEKGCQQDSQKIPDTDKTSFQKQDCCDDEQSYENVDVSSSVTQWMAKILKVVSDTVIGALVAVFKAVLALFATDPDSSSLLSSFTSLFHGRSMLSFVQSFLI